MLINKSDFISTRILVIRSFCMIMFIRATEITFYKYLIKDKICVLLRIVCKKKNFKMSSTKSVWKLYIQYQCEEMVDFGKSD